jgi:hypothetical protein
MWASPDINHNNDQQRAEQNTYMRWWCCRRLLLVLPCGCRLLLQLLPHC